MSAWIEMTTIGQDICCTALVALLVSAWIEISTSTCAITDTIVALLVSAWIEINGTMIIGGYDGVALLVSAWIEIGQMDDT